MDDPTCPQRHLLGAAIRRAISTPGVHHLLKTSSVENRSMGRSRGGLTNKIHAVVDTNGLPVRLGLTAGEAHDNRLVLKLLSRLRSGSMLQRMLQGRRARSADRGVEPAGWREAGCYTGHFAVTADRRD